MDVKRASVLGELLDGRRKPALLGEGNDWPEKNCYCDLWIGFLDALGLQSCAILPFTVAVDFEGDQWTFFKPPLAELRDLYGIDVQELTIWLPMADHAMEQLTAGKLICVESDAYWLPDTAGTDYRRKHTKTTILMETVDLEARRMRYFHNAGYFELEGEDFDKVFRLGNPHDSHHMPFFAELVHIDRLVRRGDDELASLSLALLRRHHAWRPLVNPFTRFAARVTRDMPRWKEQGLDWYHAWAFSSLRQAGSAFELAAANLRWLQAQDCGDFEAAATCFSAISKANKTLILKGARVAATGRTFDVDATIGAMARDWDRGMAHLAAALDSQAVHPAGRATRFRVDVARQPQRVPFDLATSPTGYFDAGKPGEAAEAGKRA